MLSSGIAIFTCVTTGFYVFSVCGFPTISSPGFPVELFFFSFQLVFTILRLVKFLRKSESHEAIRILGFVKLGPEAIASRPT